MELEELHRLTQKYLEGNATPEEKALLDRWYYSFEGRDIAIPADEQRLGKSIKKALQARLFHRQRAPYYAAAAVLFLLAAGFLYFRPATHSISAAVAKQAVQSLPDRSVIWLNAASKATYAKPRAVSLTGEAFFDVVHDSLHPFTVRAGEVTITDIGTSFNVKAYPGEPVVVTVSTGKVRLASSGRVAILTPGQQVTVSQTGWEERKVNAASFTGWKEGTLQFTDEPLSAVALTLERRYNIHIRLAEGVAALRSTAGFDSTANAEQVLSMLCQVHQIHFKKISEDTYVIEP